MSKKSLPVLIPLVVLLFASLACNAITGGAVSSANATVNAAYTQAAAGGATASAQGSAFEATANAAATDLVATTNAAVTGTTGGDATATPEAGQPTAAATDTGSGNTGGQGTITGAPDDIPIVAGDITNAVATAQVVSYETKSDFATVVQFYKDNMPKNGWAVDATTTLETANATVLGFTKGSKHAVVTISPDPVTKATTVAIALL